MKIVLMIESLVKGGAEGQTALSAAQLARQGQEVTILTYHPGNDYEESLREHGVRFLCVQEKGLLRIGRMRTIARRLRDLRCEVVHAFGLVASIYAQVTGRIANVPCLLSGYRATEPVAGWYRWLTRLVSGRSGGWVVNAERTRHILQRDLGERAERVYVVPNGLPLDRVESHLTRAQARAAFGLPDEKVVVSLVGRLKPQKNHAMLLRVARRVIDAGTDVEFVIAGEGELRHRIEAEVARLNLGEHVRMLGKCNRVPDLLRATDIVVLPSFSEGLANALLEGSGAGLPCIATDVGDNRSILIDGQTGFFAPIDDDEVWARRICELAADPALRQRMGAAGRQHVLAMFSQEALGRNLMAAYRKAMETASARQTKEQE